MALQPDVVSQNVIEIIRSFKIDIFRNPPFWICSCNEREAPYDPQICTLCVQLQLGVSINGKT